MASRRGSLSTRLLAITAVMLVAAFGITIVVLDLVFRTSAEEALADQLETQVFALIGAVEPDEAGNLTIPQRLLEPRLAQPRLRALCRNCRCVWLATVAFAVGGGARPGDG